MECACPRDDLRRTTTATWFTSSRGQAAVGRVQNDLVLPSFLARHWKHFPAFDSGGEAVYLPRVGKLVGKGFFGDKLSVAPQFQPDRPFNIQRIIGPEDAGITDNLQRRAIVRRELKPAPWPACRAETPTSRRPPLLRHPILRSERPTALTRRGSSCRM